MHTQHDIETRSNLFYLTEMTNLETLIRLLHTFHLDPYLLVHPSQSNNAGLNPIPTMQVYLLVVENAPEICPKY